MARSQTQKLKNKPLLYIQQPEFEIVAAGTQVYEVKAVPEYELEVSQTTEKPGEKPEEQPKTEPEESDNAIKGGVRKKVFANKTIEEKIHFLTGLPQNMPPVTCEFRTNEKVYRGVLQSYEDGMIMIRTVTGGGNIQLKREQIKEISTI